jgi:hypothetical protein
MGDWLFLLLVLTLNLGPDLVFGWATRRYGAYRDDLDHTGASLARRLLDENGLARVLVLELSEDVPDFGDNYDPVRRVVQLSRKVARERSVAAYAVAAHEVGHARQHASHDSGMELQHALAKFMMAMTYVLIASVLGLALVSILTGGRVQGRWLTSAVVVLYVCGSVLLRLVTLPVEWSASFGYALPMLSAGHLLGKADLARARMLLLVAATTYIAFALLGVIGAIVLLMW